MNATMTKSDALTEDGCEKTEFGFDELSDEAKDRAIEWMGNSNAQDWEPEWDGTVAMLKLLGFEVDVKARHKWMANGQVGLTKQGKPVVQAYDPDFAYSFGGGGGDAINFSGSFEAERVKLDELIADRPCDKTLHEIGAHCMAVFLAHPVLSCKITMGARRGHGGGMEFRVSFNDGLEHEYPDEGEREQHTDEDYEQWENAMSSIYDELTAWIFEDINTDYEWQSNRERCIEDIEANDYTFDEDGRVV